MSKDQVWKIIFFFHTFPDCVGALKMTSGQTCNRQKTVSAHSDFSKRQTSNYIHGSLARGW